MPASKFLIVGAGFSGAVLARELADRLDCEITIFDERSHVAGNCHTERDGVTGVMVHKYGPHIFHTDDERVWNYVRRFGTFRTWINRVKAVTSRGVFSLPINLHTINQFFGKTFSPDEARSFVESLSDRTIVEPKNFEEQALKLVGRELYETFFYGYTVKQWGCDPRELPASILKRLPIRFNYDDSYHGNRFQGIPEEGYSMIVQRILDHSRIAVTLEHRFEQSEASEFDHVFFTGPIDAYFGCSEGRLSYRTVTFERIDGEGDLQGNAVLNYPDVNVAHTRVHEHKHFAPWETHRKTVAFREFSKETTAQDIPYYPKHLAADERLLARYVELARGTRNVSFLGRLGTYRYLDMDRVIGEALAMADASVNALLEKQQPPTFPPVGSN